MLRTGSLDRCNGERVRASWIKACMAAGIVIAAVLGTMAVAGGHSVRSELVASSAPSGHAAAGHRGGTQVALRLVY
jgi:hypothetical protein